MKKVLTTITALALGASVTFSEADTPLQVKSPAKDAVNWPEFMAKQDMHFNSLPKDWKHAPHFGNAMVGSMIYQVGNGIRLEVFRADVQDHRDDSYGWPAYSRPRLQVGHFTLQPVGKLTGCTWHKNLWNAEMTGTIKTDKGEIKIQHFTHAEDMIVATALTPSAGEKAFTWTWHPVKATSTRSGYPKTKAQIPGFAKTYGQHYLKTLKVYKPNPDGEQRKVNGVSVWVQNFSAGGQYATAWAERKVGDTRIHLASIMHTYPKETAANDAVAEVSKAMKVNLSDWREKHYQWWHAYYPQSFVSIPDAKLEALYWQTIYRFGCISRAGRGYVDTPGLWFRGGSWCYTTTDWNIQSAHWPVYTANRLDQGQELLDRFHKYKANLIAAVRPKKWQKDSAYLAIEVPGDLISNREQDMRYYDLVGNLPWTMSNFWFQYRYSMDDEMLRVKIYPLLRRSINMYLNMLTEGEDGKLHLPPTYSPETKVFKDCNFDLALLKWGCHTLLAANKRLKLNDPLEARWKEVLERTVDFPADEHGFRLGSDGTSSASHRHASNLLMIYPLRLVNIDQKGAKDVLVRSHRRASSIKGLPAMVQTHTAPMAANMGMGNEALDGLKKLQGNLHPNGMWYSPPCLESSLGNANIVQDMLLQSWSDPTREDSELIRIFPALPDAWKDVKFDSLRAEGAFLVSAERAAGVTKWVRIKSLAGEICRVRPGMTGQFKLTNKSKTKRKISMNEVAKGIYELDLKKGEEVLLTAE
ncbi:hypothetical protein NT6N_20180 [Oceaniferula spumae]|uniref:Alpha-L-fucosidase n=1 Tax=Oceaniferula spumae TaxID=2979115 RepID=A0AAT9FM02_9BACT